MLAPSVILLHCAATVDMKTSPKTWSVTTQRIAALLVATLGFGLGTGYLIGRGPTPPPVSLNSADVAYDGLVDGDTIRVQWEGQSMKVRLLGIDCMESKPGTKLIAQSAEYSMQEQDVLFYGKLARSRTGAYCTNNIIHLVFPGRINDRDSFGRLLAYAEVDRRDIGQNLLESGLAVEYPGNHPRRDLYRKSIEDAKRKRSGIWMSVK